MQFFSVLVLQYVNEYEDRYKFLTRTLMSTALSTRPEKTARPGASVQTIYRPDQQVKYLHLQAEIDTLMLELQARKQQQLTAARS